MQVTQTTADGLRREFRVVVPAKDLDSRVNERLVELKDRVRINGFRPGKVPADHLKRLYGRSAMAEVIEAAVREGNAKIVEENNFRLAMEPQVTLPEEEGAVDAVISGKEDLSYTVRMEILAPITLADFKTIELTKPVAAVTDAEIDEAIKRIADQNRAFESKGEGAKAESGDRVSVSFVGKIDGVPFEGGTGENIPVLIGSATFIPGFEDQLIGIAAGEQRVVKATFPEAYANQELAGKDAEFDVTANAVEAPKELAIDDEFAKTLGLESLEKLKEAVSEQIKREHEGASRQRMKRALFDQLDEKHQFEVSPTLLEQEFAQIWSSVRQELESSGKTFADENTTEEAASEEYRDLAARRVRLGLLLSEIGEKNNIKVSDEEVSRAIVERTRQFPGQEKQIWEYFRNNPNAVASVRAPIFEDKVVDFLFALAKIEEKPVSREELYSTEDDTKPAA